MTTVKLTRREQREETKSRILDAALHEFSRQGDDGTNIRAIAEHAGVNHGLIKYYFGGKLKLWQKAVESMFARSRQETTFDQSMEPVEALKHYIRSYTRYCARHPEHARIMIQASMHDKERLKWAVEHQLLPHKEALLAGIEVQKKLGLWPDISNVSLIYITVSACQLVFALGAEVELLHGTNVYDEAFVESHADSVIKLLVERYEVPLT